MGTKFGARIGAKRQQKGKLLLLIAYSQGQLMCQLACILENITYINVPEVYSYNTKCHHLIHVGAKIFKHFH